MMTAGGGPARRRQQAPSTGERAEPALSGGGERSGPPPALTIGRGWALYGVLTAASGVLALLLPAWTLVFLLSAGTGLAALLYKVGELIPWLRPLYIHRRIRPTRVGSVYVLLIVVMALAAVNTGLNLLYLVFAMLAAVFLVSGFLSERVLRGIVVTLEPPVHAVAGAPCTLPVRLLNRKRLTSSWALRVEPTPAPGFSVQSGGYAPQIRPRAVAEARLRITPKRRGRLPVGDIRVSTGFPFGFVRHAWLHANDCVLEVWPRLGRCLRLPEPPPAGRPATVALAESPGDDDFHTLRDYRPGDNPRRIHWRSSARARRLLVREHRATRRGVAVVVVVGTAPEPGGRRRGAGAGAPAGARTPERAGGELSGGGERSGPPPALDDVADVAATLAASLHAAGWDVHAVLAGPDGARYLALDERRGPDAVRRALVDWVGGPAETVWSALPAGLVRGTAVLVVAPGRAAAEPVLARARELGAALVEAWCPPDVWARGWVDFGSGPPPWQPSFGVPTAGPSTT